MGRVLVGTGSLWLIGVIVLVALAARDGLAISMLLPNGMSQRLGHFVLFATIAVIGLGWLIPLGAGLVMIRRR